MLDTVGKNSQCCIINQVIELMSEPKAVNYWAKLLKIDPRTLDNLITKNDIQPADVVKRKGNSDIRLYHLHHLWAARGDTSLRDEKTAEEVRKLRRENDLEEGKLAPVETIIAVVRPIISSLSQRIDRLPDIAADACKEVDGRGRERMAKALTSEKNELAKIPEQLLA